MCCVLFIVIWLETFYIRKAIFKLLVKQMCPLHISRILFYRLSSIIINAKESESVTCRADQRRLAVMEFKTTNPRQHKTTSLTSKLSRFVARAG